MSEMSKTSLFNNNTALGRKVRALAVGALALTVLAALCGILAFALSYEVGTGYFARGAVLPVLFWGLLGLGAVPAVVCLFALKNETLPQALPLPDTRVFFVSMFACYMSGFEACFRFMGILGSDGFFSSLFASRTDRITRLSVLFDLLSFLFAILTAAAFGFMAFEKKSAKPATAWAMIPCVRCLIGILQIFFDSSLALNLPAKLIGEFALMTAVLYFLAEERLRISGTYARPTWYFAASALALCFCGAGGISLLFFYIKYHKALPAYAVPQQEQIAYETVFCIVIFLYVLVRLLAYGKAVGAPQEAVPAEEETAGNVPGAEDAAGQTAEVREGEEKHDED